MPSRFSVCLLAALAVLVAAAPPRAQPAELPVHEVVNGEGQAATLDDVVAAMAEADVVFLGERHDDAVAHALQSALLTRAHEAYGEERTVALGLEMVERDVQLVLDEYLAGLIRERDFLAASRPWTNYADYRPLLEYARAHALPVVATNAPGRYASLVAREGESALLRLSEEARTHLPPLPVAPASEPLAEAFRQQMTGLAEAHGGAHHAFDLEPLLAAQNLRDAAMAYTLAEALRRHPDALVLHVNGLFHSAGGMGIPEHLARYHPDARVVTVSFRSDASDALPGDGFVIATAPAVSEDGT